MNLAGAALSFNAYTVLTRRVLPLAITLYLWLGLIDGLRLLAAAF